MDISKRYLEIFNRCTCELTFKLYYRDTTTDVISVRPGKSYIFESVRAVSYYDGTLEVSNLETDVTLSPLLQLISIRQFDQIKSDSLQSYEYSKVYLDGTYRANFFFRYISSYSTNVLQGTVRGLRPTPLAANMVFVNFADVRWLLFEYTLAGVVSRSTGSVSSVPIAATTSWYDITFKAIPNQNGYISPTLGVSVISDSNGFLLDVDVKTLQSFDRSVGQ
jgi:hypothetical protein